MPQIIVTAERGAAFGEGAVTLRERVSVEDFESEHFATQLVERLGWAVGDADEAERVSELDAPAEPFSNPGESFSNRGEPTERTSNSADGLSVASPA